ncbi:electron transport complex subunit RsxC [Prosthecochloris sp. HL-130-GSB]|jgi:Na+-translocating ferredoxin:NAD+ oxidoreductase subunit C|uniref:electron transport complex subunit RsxC n=1 Tax=Prosthecochloris sp. HL-130-GSB TaxID=1974213 RepID=UPI000A1C0FD7|nr:electron transport complex subunit RsxC [Prosthecochloris sp. HL-130-GSB]ARM30773.1 electron transport complex subunit RsxC [Prosthecochloris sp. HL-130-GSB]MBO8093146.1 electron transport complex subunit RsxC [Prosthecochloris sp.]
MKTFKNGGVHPPENKFTEDISIEVMPVPSELAISLNQHLGKPAKPVVKVGAEVKKGQLIGEADGFISANVHASTSGKVKAIKPHPHPGGQYAMTVFITPDGQDEWAEGCNTAPQDWKKFQPKEIIEKIKQAGIVGMGGAGFPTNVKLSPPPDKTIDTIILNGAECEPFLTADHRLMVESPDLVVAGLEIISSLFQGKAKAYIGIESNKPDAIAALKKLAEPKGIGIVSLKTKYPQGAEKQLINAITGRTIEEGELPFDKGCLVQNIGTAVAVYEAVCLDKPLIERVLTVSGMEIKERKNLLARVGTPFRDIVAYCGDMTAQTNQIISGGPMMGKALFSLDTPVVKTTSGILFLNNARLDKSRERTCIRCSKCVEVCPQGLGPWLLANVAQLREFDEIQLYGLANCTECGSCTYVCPSKRELVHWIKYAKALVNNRQKRKSA